VSERLDQLKRIKKKHGGFLEAVIASREALRDELSGFESLELEVKEAERELEKRHARAVELGRLLSAARKKAKAELEARVGTELQSLAMGGAAIRFELQEATELSSEGFERGEIHIQTNRGEGFLPLHKSASGGELARVLLALKRVLMHVDPVETCIFDEVDSGTGGAVGDMIGKKLEEIGAERQVLCITHLPQIAARGRTHLKVMKVADGERTLTHVVRLGGDERVDEVARMLGGVEITKTTREHARELVGRSAEAARGDKKVRGPRRS
jgi:DNA repair protein RecN (Recombination protein N)